jgi:diguanylate cyclase (GGDEF)-like protein
VKLNFDAVDDILSRSTLGNTGQSSLIAQDGTLIAGSGGTTSDLTNAKHPLNSAASLSETDPILLEYSDARGDEVIGVLRRMSQLDWGVVAQIGKEEVYAQIVRIRVLTLAICVGLLFAIGLAAYVLVLTIVRPLERLAGGAAKVATGDLDVQLPVISRGEVGYVTEAFNNMVGRLRQGQEELTEKNKELQTLSITDSLTGLHNRKHCMDVLESEVARATRNNQPFSVAMIDADHFKEYNDTLGHQAGDALLRQIGVIFMQSLRTMDHASRYGGDEFIILLPEVGIDKAVEVAERIRERVIAVAPRTGGKSVAVTVSIGVAAFPAHGESPETIVASADHALYQAKRNGRNRVVAAGKFSTAGR